MKEVRRKVCPTCKKPIQSEMVNSKFRPFCSEQCKLIDLGHWLDGTFSIPSQDQLSEEDVESVVRHHQQKELGEDQETDFSGDPNNPDAKKDELS